MKSGETTNHKPVIFLNQVWSVHCQKHISPADGRIGFDFIRYVLIFSPKIAQVDRHSLNYVWRTTNEGDYLFPTFAFILTDKVVGKWCENGRKKKGKYCPPKRRHISWVPLNDTAQVTGPGTCPPCQMLSEVKRERQSSKQLGLMLWRVL